MNREIKFRAWDEGNKVMHHDVQFIRTGIDGNDWIVFCSKEAPYKSDNQKIVFDNPYFSQQIKLMQFTGLKAKNGGEVYEGDIVKDQFGRIMKIAWWNFRLCFLPITETHFHHADLYEWAIADYEKPELFTDKMQVEVIGNIYQNPELLSK